MFRQALLRLARKTGILSRLKWWLRRLNYRRRIRLRGVRMSVPSIAGITCRATETWMIDLLDGLLQERAGVFLDVGVNTGQTLMQVKALDRERRYIGFEPNPACAFYVGELIKENRFRNSSILPVALFIEDGILTLDLFSDDPSDSTASLIRGFRPGMKVCSRALVPVLRFESVAGFLDIEDVGIVKIDVEGAELEVVKALSELIRRHRPVIVLEVLPVYSDENIFRKARQEELERIIAEVNYAVFRVVKTRTNRYAGLRRIEGFGIHSDLSRCDYVIVPKEQSARVQTAVEARAKSAAQRRC